MAQRWSFDGVRVLVTGAGGFIGSHLTERLARAGARVRALVRYTSQGGVGALAELDRAVLDELEIVAGDIRDPDCVRESARNCEVVFHLAALIAIPYSYVHPRSYVETNITGTLNVLSAAREVGTARVVHTSTSEVYGTARYVPIDERHPLVGQSPYSATKIAADQLAESFYRSFGVPVVTLRPFNTYGPRQSARAVVPTIVMQALVGERVALGSTSPTRDLTYVTDTVEGFLAAAKAEGVEGETINLGRGEETSIAELVERVGAILGTQPTIERDERRVRPEASEVERLISDPSKARRLLGWDPQVPLDEGLRRVVEHIRAHPWLYDPGRYYT